MQVDQNYILQRIQTDQNGCWLWTGSLNNAGYGNCRANGKSGAHVVAYELWKQPVPPKHQVDHRKGCPKHCVNPQHLQAVSQPMNGALTWRRLTGQMPRRDLRVARLLHKQVGRSG